LAVHSPLLPTAASGQLLATRIRSAHVLTGPSDDLAAIDGGKEGGIVTLGLDRSK